MAQIITKQDVEVVEVTLFKVTRLDEQTGQPVTEFFGRAPYDVITDDPDYNIRQKIRRGPAAGQALTNIQAIFTYFKNQAKAEEDIP